MDESEIVSSGLLVASCDRSKSLEAMDEDLDVVPDAVELTIEASLVLSGWIAVDDGLHSACVHGRNNTICIVSGVGNERAASRVRNQLLSHHRIVDLARRERDLDRAALGVDEGMELR